MEEIKSLKDRTIAILATDGFEEVELVAPRDELSSYGAQVRIISDKKTIRSWKNRSWGNDFQTDILMEDADIGLFDALLLPGGVLNSDRLRRNQKAIEIIREFKNANKLIAAICHGTQLLIEAELVEGRNITGHHAIRKDILNAGARYEDFGVLADENIITARSSDDISSYLKKIIEVLKQPELIH